MRKLAIAAGVAATVLTVTAAGKPPATVSGTETITSASATVVRTADGNTITANTAMGTIAGSFTGTFTVEYTTIVHPSGLANAVNGTYICACSIAGRSGSVTFRFEGTGSAAGLELHAETIDATGGLEGLHSNLAVEVVGAAVTYSGIAHFAP
jgi:Protein of unknown function (DUF3224)